MKTIALSLILPFLGMTMPSEACPDIISLRFSERTAPKSFQQLLNSFTSQIVRTERSASDITFNQIFAENFRAFGEHYGRADFIKQPMNESSCFDLRYTIESNSSCIRLSPLVENVNTINNDAQYMVNVLSEKVNSEVDNVLKIDFEYGFNAIDNNLLHANLVYKSDLDEIIYSCYECEIFNA